MSVPPRTTNIVHDDENWRQRLRAEAQAAGQWSDAWGFLEHAKPPGAVYVDRSIPNRQLSRAIAEQGILYPFLLKTYRDNREGRSTTRYNVGGTDKSRLFPELSNGVNTARLWKGDADAPVFDPTWRPMRNNGHQIVGGSQTARNGHYQPQPPAATASPASFESGAETERSVYPASPPPAAPPKITEYDIRNINASRVFAPAPPASWKRPVPPLNLNKLANGERPTTPVLHLERHTAAMLVPKYEQDIGGCVWTNGVDPPEKYRHPLTSSHRVGWDIGNRSLEFFGVAQHATKHAGIKTLYGRT